MPRLLLVFPVVLVSFVCTAQALANGGVGATKLPGPIPAKDVANYRSEVRGVEPAVPGLKVSVIAGDDRLRIDIPHPGQVFEVRGFEGEPFLRVMRDGFVQANYKSRTTFSVQERFGRVDIPPGQLGPGPPQWGIVSQLGRVEWHDHRIQWMRGARPRVVFDEGKRTKIFDWSIPYRYGRQTGSIEGTLFWVPDKGKGGGGLSNGAIFGLVIFTIAAVAALVAFDYFKFRRPSRAR